jgi:nitrate/TMAO reductase-like tetraheme cytochrome c subunit
MVEQRNEKEPGTFGGLYHLLRDFWRESKKGTVRHKKGIVVFFAFVFLCLAAVVVTAFKLSETPAFCGVCHNMKVYVDSWKASTHRKVACIECHYKPGFSNHLKGKWRDGQLSLAYFITGKGPTKPHAEIDDASCLQSGCHRREDLRRPVVFKNVVFNHPQHIEQMRRQKQLRCTTCHSQIVQGAHMIVTDVECFICHFYKTKDQKEFITGCGSCHFEARGDIQVSPNFVFNHKRYIARGIKCEQCHTTVVSGDGHVPEFACLQCHNKREILTAKYTPEFLHKNHVTDHKVECFTCHSAIKHQIAGLHYKGQAADACSDCHPAGVHMEKINMYLGKGARLVDDQPNRMAVINMDCDVCHGKHLDRNALRAGCKDCHGNITDGMIDRWQKLVKDSQQDLMKEINEIRGNAGQSNVNPATKKVLDDAVFNYNFLTKGNGVHNIVYSMRIVNATKNALDEIKAKAKGTTSFKPTPFKLSCTQICHGEILEKKVPFGSVSFVHEIHAEGEESCVKCHSAYAEHGRTTLKGCSECHHGEGMGKVSCKDCHKAEEGMYRGAGVKGVKEIKDSMFGKVSCEQCHKNVKQGKKEAIATIRNNCAACHKKEQASLVQDWSVQNENISSKYGPVLAGFQKEIAAIEAKEGRHSVPLRARYDEINQALTFILQGNWAHNPQYGDAIVTKMSRDVQTLDEMIKTKKAGKEIFLPAPLVEQEKDKTGSGKK